MVDKDGKIGRDLISRSFRVVYWQKDNEPPNGGGISDGSRNGAPSRIYT